jgi:YbbR domain-containing protein
LKGLKSILIKDWQYKLFALLMGLSLWVVLNIGQRVPMSVERSIEVINQSEGYEYRLERKKVKIRLEVMERLVSEEMVDRVKAYVDVRGLKEGEYVLNVEIGDLPKFLISVDKVEPEYVKVRVIKAPGGGR